MSLIASLVDEETIDFEPRTAEEREMDREAVSNIIRVDAVKSFSSA
jgi:hypothetical protein